ncbi:hypothetical protein ACFVWY_33355 [Streptomyces sp. NPDC058195]|uniref:hypothetical protein n=1 Tax=Streptomyces sp. NPDC058195 TaxID=3346375 RepID=UPI0036EA4E08
MRKAARQLGWKVTAIGMASTRHGTMAVVQDAREVPEKHQAIHNDAMNDRMRTALHKVWGEQGPAPAQHGPVALMTQEFRAAVATGSA